VVKPVNERDPLHDIATEAASQWARTVFWAPRRFRQLIKRVDKTDEVIERVVTNVVRRTLRPVYGYTGERFARAPRVDLRMIDPFNYTQDSLRRDSEHVVGCDACNGTGSKKCARCSGTGSATCAECDGYGKFRNPSTNRMNQCKACKKTGRVMCGSCGGDGRAVCNGCNGSGHRLSWLTYEDGARWELQATPSPTIAAHPYLAEARPLERSELRAFSIERFEETNGAITNNQLPTHRTLVDQQLSCIDRRYERVVAQQYVRVAVVRRDVVYESCGTVGVLVLSGNGLTPAKTNEALRPVRRRLWFTVAGLVVFLGSCAVVTGSLTGTSTYFERARQFGAVGFGVAALCFVPWLMGTLRAWGSTSKTSIVEKLFGIVSAGAIAAAVAAFSLMKPSVAEADDALTKKDAVRARVVLDALREIGTDAHDTDELEDRILLAEASIATGERRLQVLDKVAARKGTNAAQAATTARSERLQFVRDAIKVKKAPDALASIEKWFPGSADPEITEEKARAHEAAAANCAGLPCKYAAATRALTAHATDARKRTADAMRAELQAALTPPATPNKDLLAHLKSARDLEAVAAETLSLKELNEIEKSAQTAIDWVATERAKVRVLGSSIEIVEQVFGQLKRLDTERASATLTGGLEAYFSFDKQARCTGMYVVGTIDHHRLFVSSVWSAQRLVAQAVGRPVQTKISAPSSGPLRWYEGSAPVTARFMDGTLAELRIGQAMP
jgi:hypothetical protein